MSFKIVGRFFPVAEFAAYVAGVKLSGSFKPSFVVVHNTGSPTLAQRSEGFTEQHMRNLQDYYANKQGWSGGPHLFVDDRGIWVFNPLDDAGVHSPSWNLKAWGIEMLGDYASDDPASGRGAQVIANTVAAVAILLDKINQDATNDSIKFHKEDKLTTHDCPGRKLVKAVFVAAVKARMDAANGWSVVDASGKVLRSGVMEGPLGTGLVRTAVEAIGGVVQVDGKARQIVLVRPAGAAKAEG